MTDDAARPDSDATGEWADGPSSSDAAGVRRADDDAHADEPDGFEPIVEEFAERCRRGEAPSIEGFEARHPEHAAALRRLLPMVAMMEGLKHAAVGAAHEPRAPERLGDFRIVREIGRGGMGVVYEAVQESLDRPVALKVVHHVQRDARRLQRFRREAEAVGRLHHTNIVPIFGAGEQDGLPFYVMQLIRGQGLDALVREWQATGPPHGEGRWRFAARVGRQAAEALHYAHKQGILHRDVKPANLLIDEHDAVWITDFGLAKLVGQDDLTASGDVIGTLRYLAPEALRGQTDARSDVYGLGLTLYELLTLHAPFGGLSPSELLRHVSQEQPARPRKLDPSIPGDLETIVLKATAKEPSHRYPDAGALADDLRRFLEDRPIQARRASPPERAWRWARRNRMAAALMLTAASALVLAAVVGWIGYASTAQALRRSQANVNLSLEIFESLFNRLGAEANFLPPPPGRSARRRLPMPGDRTPAARGLAGVRRRPDHGHGPDGDGTPTPDGARPSKAVAASAASNDPELIGDVLDFYDRFARQNAANPKLQVEAASAYRRVGAIHESLGQRAEARRAYDRAVAMLEALVARHPEVRDYRARLVETYIMANPWTAEDAELPAMVEHLRRAEAHADRLAAEDPDSTDGMLAMVHVQAKLATALRRLGRLDEADGRYRRALELTDRLLDREPANRRALWDRCDVREALALLDAQRGRDAEARALLEAAESDLRANAGRDRMAALADRLDDLAEDFAALGDAERAESLARLADDHRQSHGRGGPRRGD
jgi:serine/threonine protein kinase